MKSPGERIHIGTHLTLLTEHNDSGPGAYVTGVEFNGVTGMTRQPYFVTCRCGRGL